MSKPIPSRHFKASMSDRIANRPFLDISAYKVRESFENIESMCSTVVEIINVVSKGETHSSPVRLGCCTSEEKAKWLKGLPSKLAHELGFNLIPAVEALHLEGVPPAAIRAFIHSIKGSVHQLLAVCDAVQAATSRTIKGEYALMKQGRSSALRICNNAFQIADRAATFCDLHDV
jgi:hypothetical protein